jgi:C4-dicarboxylate-specific signal transduction histidine kinase
VADLLREDAGDPEKVRAHVHLIKEQAERMTRLLTAFRGGSVAPPESNAAGDVGRAAKRVRALVAYRLKERVVLDVEVPPDLPPVPLSADRLEQVLLNLVVNAIDAVEERGLPGGVVVRARREGAAVEVLVGDEGIGISEDARRRLFQPYFTTKTSDRGTGLGLVICRELVRTAGGTIDVAGAELIAARGPWPRPIRTLVRVILPVSSASVRAQASPG